MTHVLIFVPGLMGSELFDANGKVWPGSLLEAGIGFSDAHFQRLLDPALKVGGIVETAAGVVNVYKKWLTAFRAMTVSGQPLFSDAANPPTLYTVPYDWRIDVATSAIALADKIDQAFKAHGGTADIHIVAHSLGGLVTRYYLQSGKFTGRPGFGRVASFITFGTPHNGAPVALCGALGLHKTSFLSLQQSSFLANDPRYPALYQTFPDRNASVFWNSDKSQKLAVETLGNEQFAVSIGLNKTTLQQAFALRDAIDFDEHPIPKQVRCFLFIGTQENTPTHIEYQQAKKEKVETSSGGDGTVSIPGAFLPGFQTFFCGESHMDLIESRSARRVLQRLFNADGLAYAAAGRVRPLAGVETLSVDDVLPLTLVADPGIYSIHGVLIWQRAIQAEKEEEPSYVAFDDPAPIKIAYDGAEIARISLRLVVPNTPGIYRVVLRREGAPDEASSAVLVST